MELVKQENLIEFNPEQVELIRKQIAPNANKDELALFLHQCKRTGLDPLTRQIYCIHRGGKMTIQTSIDGFRVIAERSGVYAGQDEPVFTYDDKGAILKCSVTVHKFSPQGQRYPAATGVAYWTEYAQQSPMWTKMKHTMISKCAEALALRKAFPADLSGLYTTDEMQQADTAATVQTVEATATVVVNEIAEEDRKLLFYLLHSSTLEDGTEACEKAFEAIKNCADYKTYEKLKCRLEDLQPSIDEISNPSQTDIKNHLAKAVN